MEEPDLTDLKTAGFGEHSLQFSPWSQPSNKELIPSNIRAEAAPCSQRSKTDLVLLCASFKVKKTPLVLCVLQKF